MKRSYIAQYYDVLLAANFFQRAFAGIITKGLVLDGNNLDMCNCVGGKAGPWSRHSELLIAPAPTDTRRPCIAPS